MSLISMKFLIFVFVAVVGYYLIPKKYQWIWLLLFSYIYYASSGFALTFFLIYATTVTYGSGILLGRVQKDIRDNKSIKKRKRFILIMALILDFGMLAVLKYSNFAIENLNTIFNTGIHMKNLLLPLGISFYTFQSAGYIMDVYWKRCDPETNVFRFALFVSFFPQILQGPIGRYNSLAYQLFEPHKYNKLCIERGMQLILWGYFKKLVLAETAAVFVNEIFNNYKMYPGLALFGVLGYSVQLYGDFSGGMDVVMGIASLFGIKLNENFKRPYFAVSITDFWHRWHITLGTWMKDYVFYPLSLSRAMGRFGTFAKKRFGKSYGRILPICIANIVVFLIVGVWHGAAWKFIIYGLYNGLIIAFSGLMAQNYRKWKKVCHVNDKSGGYRVFQIVRTFLLVNISWFFDRAETVHQALVMMNNSIMYFTPEKLLAIKIGMEGTTYTILAIGILLFGCAVLFSVSIMQERGIEIRNVIETKPWIVRWAMYMLFLISLPLFGQPPDSTGGFIYAQF